MAERGREERPVPPSERMPRCRERGQAFRVPRSLRICARVRERVFVVVVVAVTVVVVVAVGVVIVGLESPGVKRL
jgi:hypothetical protein